MNCAPTCTFVTLSIPIVFGDWWTIFVCV